jgi:DNA end-binding protein Ku
MSRAIWKGDLSFGLVTIPVELHPAEEPRELAFHLLDGRTMAPVKQHRVNAETGEEVPWEDVVKGYEYEDGKYVVLADDDFRAANVEATRSIDILSMVRAEEIPLVYFDKPYYLVPATQAARKAYALLRETLDRSGYVALAYVVIRTRQHVAAVVPVGDVLVLEVMRFPYELRAADDLGLPGQDLSELGVTEKELAMAGQLVSAMVEPFDPSRLHDSYRDDLLALIHRKIETGEVSATAEPEPAAQPAGGEVVDMMALLKRSLDEVTSGKGA